MPSLLITSLAVCADRLGIMGFIRKLVTYLAHGPEARKELLILLGTWVLVTDKAASRTFHDLNNSPAGAAKN